jgi:hypothetical protein
MARSLSSAIKTAMYNQETDEVFLVLLEINHSTMDTPLYFVNNTENITSNSQVYTAYPFLIDLPSDDPEKLPHVSLIIDNIDRSILETLRGIDSPPTISLSLVLASDPDTLELGPLNFTLKNITYDALTIKGDLSYEDILSEGFPKDSFTPENFPGLF